jgi:hypothetical protein
MDVDKVAGSIGELIKNPLLLLAIIGLVFCLVAGLGSWPGSQSAPIGLLWRVGLGVIGLAVAGVGLVPVVKQAIRTSGGVKPSFGIEGKYYAEGNRKYVNVINRVSENIYRIKSQSWEGVGFVDGNFYYGIYKYTDNPDAYDAGSWGAHRAEIRFIDELPMFVIELSDKFDKIGERYRWEKAEKADIK